MERRSKDIDYKERVTLNDVLYVKDLSFNLFSLTKGLFEGDWNETE